jgi:cytochrome oxidase Cu insertion factor (SCO1/SenC/PrrC family)
MCQIAPSSQWYCLDARESDERCQRALCAKVSLGKAADDYTVDHTAFICLMDRDGNYLGFFPPGTSADRMVEIIRPRLAEPAR